jgi:hypothetical protein
MPFTYTSAFLKSMFSNYPSFDSLPNTSGLTPVLIATAYGSSQTGNNDAGYIINSDEETRWTSKGIGESVVIELSDEIPIKRIDIEWDPTLSRTGQFDVALTQMGQSDPIEHSMYEMNSMLWSSITYHTPIPAVAVVTIKCYGNKNNDLNGITHVKIYELS